MREHYDRRFGLPYCVFFLELSLDSLVEFSISLHCQMFPDDSTPFLSAAELRGSKMKI